MPVPEEIQWLRDHVGHQVILQDQSQPSAYDIVTEMKIADDCYVCLHPANEREQDMYIYRYRIQPEQHVIEPIDDDDEWERVADAFDEWLYEKQRQRRLT